MSDAVFDRGLYFLSPTTDWFRGRPFKVAIVGSLLIHAALIALVPGFRAVVIEPPKVLNVEIIFPEQPQAQPMPLREVMPPPQRTVVEESVRPEPQIEPRPAPVLRQPDPDPRPIPRAEIAPPPPRPEPLPELVAMPKPEPRPEPRIEPEIEVKPEARVEPQPELPPVERAESLPEPRTEVRPEPQPVARVEPLPPPVAAVPVQPVPVAVPPPVAEVAPVQTIPSPKNSETVATEQLRRKQEIFSAAASKKLRETLNNAVYPDVGRKRPEWRLVLQVRVSAEGVVGVSVSEGSGERAIDNVVIRNLRSAPKDLRELVPADLRGQAFSATVPIRIQIQKS